MSELTGWLDRVECWGCSRRRKCMKVGTHPNYRWLCLECAAAKSKAGVLWLVQAADR